MILHLTLKKRWFDMIASGEKKEEYREIKPYWDKRLTMNTPGGGKTYKPFTVVRFKHGYAKDAPTIEVQCLGIKIAAPYSVWSEGPRGMVFVIKLGDILSRSDEANR